MKRLFLFSLIHLLLFSGLASAATSSFYFQNYLFKLVTPQASSQKKPLLLLLHGCKQNSDIIINGTKLDQEAIKRKFYLLVPEQSVLMNSDHCWNWFYSYQQMRGNINEMMVFVSAIDFVSQYYPVDSNRIYVAGLSAGGAMAHNLEACYPDYFSGVAVHSGLAYKTAENLYEAQTVLTASSQKNPEYLGKRAFECGRFSAKPPKLKKVMIIHGADDKRVPTLHADLISSTNEVIDDLSDDGEINHSNTPTVYERVENFENGRKAFITDKRYRSLTERKILVQGMQHAWGGGKPISANFDPEAPSSNQFILNFFNL